MTACPHCGSAWTAPDPQSEASRLQDLARVATVAEAGYLVSLLESAGIAASIKPLESFSAVTGAWSASHVVRVAEADAVIAAGLLRAEAREQHLEVALASGHPQEAEQSDSVNPWKMLAVLTAVVATGTFLTSNNSDDHQKARVPAKGFDADLHQPEPESSLALALRQTPTTFYATEGDGGRRRLSYSERSQAWTLSVDQDRDGQYETHRRFTVTQPVAAAAIDR